MYTINRFVLQESGKIVEVMSRKKWSMPGRLLGVSLTLWRI